MDAKSGTYFLSFLSARQANRLRRRVERLNRLDVQIRHAGIKARPAGNEKREEKPRLADSLLATTKRFLKNRILTAEAQRRAGSFTSTF
jgi:hypothetical protein